MSDLRRVEKLYIGLDYMEIHFYELKQGDIFRMWEPTGEPTLWDGERTFLATSDAYENNGIWTVDSIKLKDVHEYETREDWMNDALRYSVS